jgi:branched-chain amino acid transport system substrate-binding protein
LKRGENAVAGKTSNLSRRSFATGALAAGAVTAIPLRRARASNDPIKIGIILPYSGVYSKFGEGITDGFEFVLKQRGGQLGGRAVEILKGDDQLDAKIGGEIARKFVTRDHVDIVVGTVGSNVAPVLQKICVDSGTPLIIPTAAANELTRSRCNPLVFRTSQSHWQLAHPMGPWLYGRGIKRVTTMAMNYAAGKEEIESFAESFKAAGGDIIDQKYPGLQELDYQAYFADVLDKKPDGIFTFFAGSNAVEFVKQYAQAGLKEKVPLFGVQYLIDSTLLPAQGAAADGVIVSAYWVPSLPNEANRKFVADFEKATGKTADLNSMHGHDTATVLALALEATKGDIADKAKFSAALAAVEFQSPRGPFRFSKAHNPIMNLYAVEARGGQLKILETIAPNLADPATGCSL